MYEKYPISGIKQSYRHTRETPTVVMPILIVSLMAAMAVFFVKSKPEETAEPQDIVSIEEETPPQPVEAVPAPQSSEPKPALEETGGERQPESIEPEKAARGINTVSSPPESSGEFTPWMTPLALDTYIRARNEGFSESFWQRGHWITAVEGRWSGTGREFRIALDKVPDLNRWQWQYRVNQTTGDFATASREFADQGFKLVHAQSFNEPGGGTRFQAVWQRELKESAPVVEATSAPAAEPSDFAPGRSYPSPDRRFQSTTPDSLPRNVQPLDVNNLRFR